MVLDILANVVAIKENLKVLSKEKNILIYQIINFEKGFKEIFLYYIIMTQEKNLCIEENIEIPIKQKKLGRPRKNDRWLPDGTFDLNFYNVYFEQHYHKPHTCIYCGKTRKCCDNKIRHEKSKKCQLARQLLEQKELYPSVEP